MLENRKARKIIKSPKVAKIISFFKNIENRPVSEVIGYNWRDFPISMSSEALIIIVDARINEYGESLASETFNIEFQGSNSSGEFHLWNDKGAITTSSIQLIMRDHMDELLSNNILNAMPGGRCSCWLIVEKDGVVVSGKYFWLSKEITEWIINAGLFVLNKANTDVGENKMLTVQRVEKLCE